MDRLGALLQTMQVQAVHTTFKPDSDFHVMETDGNYILKSGASPELFVRASVVVSGRGAAAPLITAVGCFSMTVSKTDETYPLVTLLLSELDTPRCGGESLLAGYAQALIIHFLRRAIETGTRERGIWAGLSDPKLARMLIQVHQSPEKPWTIETLAQEAGMSRSVFMARFQTIMGEAPISYLRRFRIARAREALRGGARIAQVARNYGYGSTDAFTRAFRRSEGVAPSEFRNRAS